MPDSKSLVLEYDDLHFLDPENCLTQIEEFVRLFPSIKISFFSVPMLRGVPLYKNKDWCQKIEKYISSGNVCLARHGLTHKQEEFKQLDYEDALLSLQIGDAVYDIAKLPYVKVFRGPHWGINESSVHALLDCEYTHLYNHLDYKNLGDKYRDQLKCVYYNWNLKREAPHDLILVTHGHTHNVCMNGIEETFNKVCSFIDKANPTFRFVHEI